MSAETTELRFLVVGMSCERCRTAVTAELVRVSGVDDVAVDLDTKIVRVRGTQVDAAAVRAAIDDAGYDAVIA